MAKFTDNINESGLETPFGTLYARASQFTEDGYPGIEIALRMNDGTDVLLTRVEYTETESVCGYDPEHPEVNAAERAEVPVALLKDAEHVLPTLVTKAYDYPLCDGEPKRVFHVLKKEVMTDGANVDALTLLRRLIRKSAVLEAAERTPHYFSVRGFLAELPSYQDGTSVDALALLRRAKGYDCYDWLKGFINEFIFGK